jgi:hypothetical protein
MKLSLLLRELLQLGHKIRQILRDRLPDDAEVDIEVPVDQAVSHSHDLHVHTAPPLRPPPGHGNSGSSPREYAGPPCGPRTGRTTPPPYQRAERSPAHGPAQGPPAHRHHYPDGNRRARRSRRSPAARCDAAGRSQRYRLCRSRVSHSWVYTSQAILCPMAPRVNRRAEGKGAGFGCRCPNVILPRECLYPKPDPFLPKPLGICRSCHCERSAAIFSWANSMTTPSSFHRCSCIAPPHQECESECLNPLIACPPKPS